MFISKKLLVLISFGVFLFLIFQSQRVEENSHNALLITPSPIVEQTKVESSEIPECFMGNCPEYLKQEWNIYGPEAGASIIRVPTAMSKGAGQIWVIHLGKAIYKSPEFAGVSARVDSENSKLFINYISEWQDDGLHPKIWETDELVYKDSKFELTKISMKNEK